MLPVTPSTIVIVTVSYGLLYLSAISICPGRYWYHAYACHTLYTIRHTPYAVRTHPVPIPCLLDSRNPIHSLVTLRWHEWYEWPGHEERHSPWPEIPAKAWSVIIYVVLVNPRNLEALKLQTVSADQPRCGCRKTGLHN